MRLRKKLLLLLIALTQRLGTKLRDRNGKVLCRAWVWSSGGHIHLIGLPNHVQLRPVPLPQERLSYWKQTLAWEQAGPPNFPRLGRNRSRSETPQICHVVICHRPPRETEAVFKRWQTLEPAARVLIAYGGTKENFNRLSGSINAVYISDATLRTTDHARERQQYAGVFRAAHQWLTETGSDVSHVHVVEFDVIPVIENPGQRLVETLEAEDADVIGYGLVDITNTIHPQNRHQISDETFLRFIRELSSRESSERVFSMLGCSSLWTRAAFAEIAELEAPQIYLEVAIPTLAHHLGYRVRPVPALQERSVTFESDLTPFLEEYQKAGAWLVHPCKSYWENPTFSPSHPPTSLNDSSAEKPRLLLFGHTYGAAVNRSKAEALSKWFDVLVCSPDFEGIEMMGRDGSFQDWDIPDAPYQHRRLRRWPREDSFMRSIAKGLGKQFEAWQPDIVLCEEEPWAFLRWQCRFLSWQQKPQPVFAEFTWENLARPGLKGKILSTIYRFAAKTTDGVICGNRGAESLFLKAGLDPSQILRTGQLGVEPAEHPTPTAEEIAAWRATNQLSPHTFVVGFCGRYVEEKGIYDLLRAVENLRSAGLDCALVFLGAGELEADLRRKAEERPWFRLLPAVGHLEVPKIINKFDLFVLPSKPQLDPSKGIWEEQFGHVLIEAMMCRVPCIGSRSGGIPEVLDREDVTFPPGDVDALTGLISRLVQNPQETGKLALAQQEQTRRRWTHDALAKQYAEFLLNLLSKTGAR